jgi:L-lysine exporter family protein LysE/ArgO
LLAATFIVSIGANNAFVLRQGLKCEHIFVLCLLCNMADAVLTAAGVASPTWSFSHGFDPVVLAQSPN